MGRDGHPAQSLTNLLHAWDGETREVEVLLAAHQTSDTFLETPAAAVAAASALQARGLLDASPTRNEARMRTVSIRSYLDAALLIGAGQLLAGCGGTTDNGPSAPQVAGTYSITESVDTAPCTPVDPPPGGTVRLEAFSQTYDVQITQSGARLSLFEVGNPGVADTGRIEADSTISFSDEFVFEEAPREGNRVFFVDLTINRELRLQSTGQIAGTASYVDVFHEGSSTADVYATCSRQGTNQLVPK